MFLVLCEVASLDSDVSCDLQVKPFLRMLRPTGGLRHLTLIGLKDEQNLRDFKHGFVKEGGTFRDAPLSDKAVATFIVTHKDLPKVSQCVRAIVEKSEASRAGQTNEHAVLAT